MTYIFDDDKDALSTKYVFGKNKPKLSEIESYTLSFAYDYTSLNQTDLCFDYSKIPADDYHEVYYLKQEISLLKISDLINHTSTYRFHPIDYAYKRAWLFKEYAKILNVKIKNSSDYDKLPTLYQIAVYTDQKTGKAPRIVGFIGNYGIFHLVWFDYTHKIFPAGIN